MNIAGILSAPALQCNRCRLIPGRVEKGQCHIASRTPGSSGAWPSMLYPVQAPPLRHALELVRATILEVDLRLRHQIPDRAGDQHFAGTRPGGDARADVKRKTDHVSPAHFVFA